MLAYAPTDRPAARHGSPRTLVLVLAGHAALLTVVLTARGDIPGGNPFTETDVIFVDPPKPPPPPPPAPSEPSNPTRSTVDRPVVIVPTPQPIPQPLDVGPPIADPTPFVGSAIVPHPLPFDPPTPIVRKAARFITPADDVRPPYPDSKRRLDEEASLRLTLHIDERGRVIAVDSVGAADPTFLDAARRHILRRWRYAPATHGGAAIASRIVVTLSFELDD